jgi:hypothetical protein
MKATGLWQLPNMKADNGAERVASWILNDWQLSTVWTGSTGTPYSVAFNYSSPSAPNVNLTGSPDYGARIVINGDAGAGCSSNQYAQFNTAVFSTPVQGKGTGLESSNNYLKSCFASVIDLSLARNIRLGGGRSIQLRVDMFNFNNGSEITGRVTTMTAPSLTATTTIVNAQYLADGTLDPKRVKPTNAGFGAANSWQAPRTLQAYIRFSF